MTPSSQDDALVSAIQQKHNALCRRRALLVAVSGIDAAGKGFVTARLAERLEAHGLRPAVINGDGWLNLPHVRFNPADPPRHFYGHAIRFEEMFALLVDPLTRNRSIQLEADFTEESAADYRKQTYAFTDIDVVLLEGIFLLQRAYFRRFDLTVWIDCSFETALRRAIKRGQEGLAPADTVRAFQDIYFPAQRIHFECDDPRSAADFVIENDPAPNVS